MIRFGLAQMNIAWEDVEKNKEKVEYFLKKAREEKVDWIVFPEMTMTGFSMNTSMAVYYEEINTFFEEKAKEYKMGIVYGIIARGEGEKFENHLILVDETGKRIMEYAKIHPFTYGAEGKYYTGGEKVYACHWRDAVFSGFICYDLRFPPIFQVASEKAQVIFVIANWPMERTDQWDALLRARAIENACYVVGVNRTGRAGSLQYNGHSAVYDYVGRCISEIKKEETLILAEVEEEKVEEYRNSFPCVQDRRPDLYRKLTLEIK